jgi:hypothetical protein
LFSLYLTLELVIGVGECRLMVILPSKCRLSSADAGGSSATRVIHAKHVWAPIQLVLSRNLAKTAALTSPSQLLTGPNEHFF